MPLLAGLGPFGVPELLLILVIVVLIFGVGKLPEVGGAVGRGIREFRKATKDEDETKASVVANSAGQTDAGASAPPVGGDAIFCGECGAKNPRDAKFCAQCGHSMGAPIS